MSAARSFSTGARHYRRTRPVPTGPPPRSNRRTWIAVLGIGAAILASVTALSVGSFVLSTFGSVPPQSSAGGIPNAPPGVFFVEASAVIVNATSTPAAGQCAASNLGTPTSPTLLTNGVTTGLCMSHQVGGFAAADTMYTLEISWTSAAANATMFKLQVSIDVTPSANDLSLTSYVNTSATISTSESAVYALDMTESGDTSVTGFSTLVTQL